MNFSQQKRQQGAVLLVALIFLLLIAMIAATSMTSSTLEVYMSANEQSRLDAQQKGQAVIDWFADQQETFRVTAVGYTRCNSGNANADCDTSANLAITDADLTAMTVNANDIQYSSEFYFESSSVPAVSLGNASGQAYNAAYFDIYVSYDETDSRGGRSEVSQGIGVRVPRSSQSSGEPGGTDSDSQMQAPVTP